MSGVDILNSAYCTVRPSTASSSRACRKACMLAGSGRSPLNRKCGSCLATENWNSLERANSSSRKCPLRSVTWPLPSQRTECACAISAVNKVGVLGVASLSLRVNWPA
ncbi:hypothetical protein D3C72_1442480 [compost metagenome]